MKNTKICFVLIYNHNYEANIAKLEKIYGDKFTHIFHLMPFYSGKKENVIPVYQSSYFFCDFVRQGLPSFYDESFTHYVFCADDLLLNPMSNENNIVFTLCKGDSEAGFITEYKPLKMGWYWTLSVLNNLLYNNGCHFLDFLPSYEEACRKMGKHGLSSKGISIDLAKELLKRAKTTINNYILTISPSSYNEIIKQKNLFNNKSIYPLVYGFSDFFILPAHKIKEICKYFGIFSSGSIFTEVAVPTSMLLCLDKIFTLNDVNSSVNILWGKNREKLLENYNADFDRLYESFLEDLLYIHPVKLSQWKMKE